MKVKSLSCIWLFATPWTIAYQVSPSMGFSRQEYWSGLPFPSPMHESKSESESLSGVWLLATSWTAAHQVSPSMGFSRQEYWSGVPLPSHFSAAAAAAVKSLQSCTTLCDPIDVSPPGSPLPRILQARTLEWVAISFSNAWKSHFSSHQYFLCKIRNQSR